MSFELYLHIISYAISLSAKGRYFFYMWHGFCSLIVQTGRVDEFASRNRAALESKYDSLSAET